MGDSKVIYSEDQQRAFRRALGQFATGVTIITTHWKGQNVGMTANSFSSLSLDPRLVLWSIRKQSGSFASFCEGDHFAINMLAADQIDLSQRFASPAPSKFDAVGWRPGAGGAPLLDGALVTLECRRAEVYDGGDHVILVGEVLEFAMREKRPLLFVQGRYAEVSEPPPAHDPSPAAGTRDGRDISGGPTLLSLLNQAQRVQAEKFEKSRAAHDASYAESRILAILDRHPGTGIDALIMHSHMARQDLEDTVRTLVERALVQAGGRDGFCLTDAGAAKRKAIGKSWRDFQDAELNGISGADIAAARHVLSRLAGR